MRTIQVNVGLSNNPLTADQVVNYFATLQGYRLMAYYVTTKTYLGEPEETFVGMLEYNYANDSKVLQDFEKIASEMNQDCIALSTKKMEVLAFNPSYSGEVFRFDSELFEYMKDAELIKRR